MRITSFIAFSTLGLALVACRGSSNNNTPDSPGGGDGPSGAVKIQDVQNDQMAPGTPVSLSGVIVTAIDSFGAKTGDIWVEEPEGGAFSGIHIFGVPATAVGQLQIGDIVDVSGAVKDEFALTADTTGRTETELKAAMGGMITVTKTGTGTVPAPQVVDALMIGQISDADMGGPMFSAEWEKWEGVLVTVNNVSAVSAVKSFGSTMPTPADNYSFGITGVAKVEGSLTDITMSGIQRDTCMASVTGVVDYFFDYLVLPRSSTDIGATGATGCPAAETACHDSIDNDGNGYADCGATKGDSNCIITDNTCRAATTIASLDGAQDNGTALPTGGLEIGTVYISAIARNGKDFWVADNNNTAGNDNGLYVFAGGATLPTGAAVGKPVTIIGTASAYNNDMMGASLLELNSLQVTVGTGASHSPNAKSITNASTITTDATAKPLIGSLVTMTNVAVVTLGNATNHGAGSLKQNGTTFEYQSDIIANYLTATGCFASATGIVNYDVYTNAYSLELTAAPSGTSAACN